MANPAPPVIAIVGWKNSGKTTLVVRLVAEFTRRGYRIATIKHTHHEIAFDDGETDSARHRRAGAHQTALVSGNRWFLVTETADGGELDLRNVVARLAPADLVIVEGYKSASVPKIETRRKAQVSQSPLAEQDTQVIAIAADHAIPDATVAVFHVDDVRDIADHISRALNLPPLVVQERAPTNQFKP